MKFTTKKIINVFRFDDKKEQVNIFERIKELEYECMLMQRYINSENKEINAELLDSFSALSIKVRNLNECSDITDDECKSLYKESLSIHNQLSILSKPANPVSIKYTEYSKGLFLVRNKIVNYLMILTVFSLVLFVVFTIFLSKDKAFSSILLIVSASGLGSGFYTLTTVRKYIINRTYNPRYTPTYIIRFILGITSGTILALFLKDTFVENGYSFSVELLALIGGFSADAVTAILQRIADTLITIVKGPDSFKANDKKE